MLQQLPRTPLRMRFEISSQTASVLRLPSADASTTTRCTARQHEHYDGTRRPTQDETVGASRSPLHTSGERL